MKINEDLHNLYSSPNIRVFIMIKSRKLILAGHVARMKNIRNIYIYKDFVGKPDGERPLGSPRRRLEDNIKMDLREIKWGDID
jgi:hypothetical protein